MKNILKNRNTTILSVSLTATLFIYSFLNGSSLVPALLFGAVSVALLLLRSTPRSIYSIGLVAGEAILISLMVQEVLLPIAQGYDEQGGVDLYLVYGIVLQLIGFLLFPILALFVYRYVNGRTWVNLLVVFLMFDAAMFLAMTDMGNVPFIIIIPLSALLLCVTFMSVNHLVIKRKFKTPDSLPFENPELVTKVLNQNGVEPLKENDNLLFSIDKKHYRATLIAGQIQVSSLGIFLDKKDITNSISHEFKNSRKINVLINESMKKDLVSKVKAVNPSKPDGESNDVYIMNLTTFSEFINK